MKLLFRSVVYALVIVLFVVGSALMFKKHPDVQFAFLLPGVLIVIYSTIRDDIFTRHTTLRELRGR